MKYYLLQIQGGDFVGIERPPVAVVTIGDRFVEQANECRAELLKLKKKFETLDYLVLRDYNPDFPEKVSPETQEKLGDRYDNVVNGDAHCSELTKSERDAIGNGTLWRTGYCLLHISDTGIWWEAVDKYSDTHFSTSELVWGELGDPNVKTKRTKKAKCEAEVVETEE